MSKPELSETTNGTIPSVNAIISSALARPKLPEFAFITITNPKDTKDPAKLSKIRRHARESTIRANHGRRKHARNLVFDLPEPRIQDKAGSNTTFVHPTNIAQSYMTSGMNQDGSLILSLGYLRPIGHGRGLSPLAPFPAATTSRINHMLNYGM